MGKRILIVTTYYPPDTAIAAVRPYMLAKYLTELGNQVTVLRSGEINAKADYVFLKTSTKTEVFSYLGSDSPAERFQRGENVEYIQGKSRISFFPVRVRTIISKIYHKSFSFVAFYKKMRRTQQRFKMQKGILNRLKECGKKYDVVFATFGELENVYAGQYASELFDCKYILDFRDLIAQRGFNNFIEYSILKRIQEKAVAAADAVTVVSACAASELRALCNRSGIYTLNNGYEPVETGNVTVKPAEGKLAFCYTGQLYSGKRDASPIFKALSELQREHSIDLVNVFFFYAGKDFEELRRQAEQVGVEKILQNCGYLGRDDIQKLQAGSDIFSVLSWNTKKAHGILTGKFYEGIRCERPILTIVAGDEANSELKLMNEKYHYGFCYEDANKKTDFKGLKSWILEAYNTKMSGHSFVSKATPDLATDFRYDHLANKLDEIIHSL